MYGGTRSEMERLLADAEKITGVHYDISNLGDVYEAIHVIQGELGITGVAAEEAKTTISGSFEAMKASAQNLIGHMALGDEIKPQLEQFGSSVVTFLKNLLPVIGNVLKGIGGMIVDGIKSLPDLLSSAADAVHGIAEKISGITSEDANTVLSNIGSWINGTLVPFLTQQLLPALGQLGQSILELIGAFFTNIFPMLLQKATEGLTSLTESLKGVSAEKAASAANEILSNIGAWITGTLGPYLINTLLPALGQLGLAILQFVGELIAQLWNYLKAQFPVFQSIENVIVGIVQGAVSTIKGIINGIQTVIDFIKGVFTTVADVISAIWNGIKNTLSGILNGIKNVFSNTWNGIKTTVTNIVNGIKNAVVDRITAMKNAVSGPLNAVKNAFHNTFSGIKNFVGGIVDWLKGIFNFHWSLPKIKLPHFSINGKFSLNPPSVPHFDVDWYAKGGILTGPTIFGVSGNTLLGGGEAGPEAVLPISRLEEYIDNAVAKNHNNGFVQNVNIYSPKALSPSEIARQTRNATRQMALSLRGIE